LFSPIEGVQNAMAKFFQKVLFGRRGGFGAGYGRI
jgi:hypothetical protein